MTRIYLACPYTHPDKAVMEQRFDEINRVAGHIMSLGHLVFSPISHSHPIAAVCELPREFEFWSRWNFSFLDWADELWVQRMEGWEESRGVKAEIAYARAARKPILYL